MARNVKTAIGYGVKFPEPVQFDEILPGFHTSAQAILDLLQGGGGRLNEVLQAAHATTITAETPNGNEELAFDVVLPDERDMNVQEVVSLIGTNAIEALLISNEQPARRNDVFDWHFFGNAFLGEEGRKTTEIKMLHAGIFPDNSWVWAANHEPIRDEDLRRICMERTVKRFGNMEREEVRGARRVHPGILFEEGLIYPVVPKRVQAVARHIGLVRTMEDAHMLRPMLACWWTD